MRNPRVPQQVIDRRVRDALVLSERAELVEGRPQIFMVTIPGDDGVWTGYYCGGAVANLTFAGYN